VNGLLIVASLALFIAVCSATQDVAIDAYRVELIPKNETAAISHGSAMTTCGWWVGYGFLGVVPFMIADLPGWDWGRIYFILAALWVPLMIAVFWAPKLKEKRDRFEETERQSEAALAARSGQPNRLRKILAWLGVTVLEPIREFFRRSGPRLAIFVLIFIFTFKLGEAFLGRMSIVFYKEIGFTDSQIGIFSKGLTGLVTIVFSILGSIINARFGLIKGLMIGGISMAASNLMFSWIAMVGPDVKLYAVAIIVDGFTTAFSTVAFVAFISFPTSHTYTATQYALMASLGNLGRTMVSSSSGAVVDAMGGNWALFFVITSRMVIPSLVILLYVG
jgi:PAT family beta-lactamase induction signal transducer AmpG